MMAIGTRAKLEDASRKFKDAQEQYGFLEMQMDEMKERGISIPEEVEKFSAYVRRMFSQFEILKSNYGNETLREKEQLVGMLKEFSNDFEDISRRSRSEFLALKAMS